MSRKVHSLRDWLLQRFTALYMALFVVYVVVQYLLQPPAGFAQWSAWIGHPLMAIVTAGFILAVLVHSWVGIRDVMIDYIHPVGMRLALLVLTGLYLAGCGFWALRTLILATA